MISVFCDFLLENRIHTKEDMDAVEQLNPIRPYATAEEMIAKAESIKAGRRLPSVPEAYEAEFKEKMVHYNRELGDLLKRKLFATDATEPPEVYADFYSFLPKAQKFQLTKAFIDISLAQMASAASLEKAVEWFRLPHDPMWIEYVLSNETTSVRIGQLLMKDGSDPGGDPEAIRGIVVLIAGERTTMVVNFYIYPETLRLVDGKIAVKITMSQESVQLDPRIGDKDDFEALRANTIAFIYRQVLDMIDFVIRINSPAVTDIGEPVDYSKLNKKRVRSGKLPMQEMRVVDLSKHIKAALKQSGLEHEEEGYNVRYHWRRGHFKTRKTGIFWWSPHTAGRKELGEIKKEYVA